MLVINEVERGEEVIDSESLGVSLKENLEQRV